MERATKNFILSAKKQKRENKSLLFLDNAKIIKDALASKTIKPHYILTSKDTLPFVCEGVPVFKVDQKTIEILADSKTPQGVICCAEFLPCVNIEAQNGGEHEAARGGLRAPKSSFLVLDDLQDPGNVGTLLRTALATGFMDVFALDGVKVTNSKVVRSSAGAIFSLNIMQTTKADFIEFAKNEKLSLLCCDMNGENIFNFKTNDVVGVVVGNEGQGVSQEIRALCKKTVSIPMKNGLDSLNAGVSGSIVMYQINKNQF